MGRPFLGKNIVFVLTLSCRARALVTPMKLIIFRIVRVMANRYSLVRN